MTGLLWIRDKPADHATKAPGQENAGSTGCTVRGQSGLVDGRHVWAVGRRAQHSVVPCDRRHTCVECFDRTVQYEWLSQHHRKGLSHVQRFATD